MGRRRGKKFLQVWGILILAALALPFRKFLEASKYKSADAFFEEILSWVLLGSIVVLPLAVLLFFRRKKKKIGMPAESYEPDGRRARRRRLAK